MRMTQRARCMLGWKSLRSWPACKPVRTKSSPRAWASRPASSSLAIWSGSAPHRSRRLSAIHPIWPRDCKVSLKRVRSLLRDQFAEQIGDRFRLKDLGKHVVKGHRHVWTPLADQGLFLALRGSWVRSCLRPFARRIGSAGPDVVR